jgi:5-formyltetrahydrofolate cyclo-ligase
MEIITEKRVLRNAMKLQRDALPLEYKRAYDTWICTALEILIIERNCKVVHAYLPMGNEIDISPLIEKLLKNNITVVVPKTLKNRKLEHLILTSLDNLEPGVYGTSHPKNDVFFTGELDLILVPGLAFDAENYRLGYGGGYYDTFLAEYPTAFTVGLAYPFQQLNLIPKEVHDACLDLVLVKE